MRLSVGSGKCHIPSEGDVLRLSTSFAGDGKVDVLTLLGLSVWIRDLHFPGFDVCNFMHTHRREGRELDRLCLTRVDLVELAVVLKSCIRRGEVVGRVV